MRQFWLLRTVIAIAVFYIAPINGCGGGGDGAGTGTGPGGTSGTGLEGLLQGSVSDGSVASTICDGEPIEDAEDLSCDNFECLWQNVGSQEDDVEWSVGDGDPDPSLMEKYTGTRRGPDSEFAYLYPEEKLSRGDKGFFVSCPIECQDGRGTLRLKHWITENAKLEVCTRPIGDIDTENCEEIDSDDNPGPTTVRIPGSDDPFEIVIQGTGFTSDKDFIIIDDVEYDAELCEFVDVTTEEPTTERPITDRTRPPTERPTEPPDDGRACSLFNCNFNSGTECNSVARSSSSWKIGSGRTGNLVTGVKGNSDRSERSGSYAYLEGPSSGDSLTFTDVNFNSDKELAFKLYKASYESIFEVLVDGRPGLRQDETRADSRQWESHRFRIPEGQHTIEFVGSNLQSHEYIGLDDFRLLNDNGSPAC